jgi:hypothetical protein
MIVPLLALSLLALVFIVERTLFLHRGRIRAAEFLDGVRNNLRHGRLVQHGGIDLPRQFEPQDVAALWPGDTGFRRKMPDHRVAHAFHLPLVAAPQAAQVAFVGARFQVFGKYVLGHRIGAAASSLSGLSRSGR